MYTCLKQNEKHEVMAAFKSLGFRRLPTQKEGFDIMSNFLNQPLGNFTHGQLAQFTHNQLSGATHGGAGSGEITITYMNGGVVLFSRNVLPGDVDIEGSRNLTNGSAFFNGWKRSDNDAVVHEGTSQPIHRDLTLTAQWMWLMGGE